MAVRVLHILPSARGYGAERQIVELLPLLQNTRVSAALLTIYDVPASDRRAFAFETFSAGRRGRGDYLFMPRLVREIRRFRPDVVHTHTHVGKYWGRAAALLAGAGAIVHTEHNPCDPRRTRLEWFADPALHRITARIVTFFGEQRAYLAQRERAPLEKISVIPNGVRAQAITQCERADARSELAADGRFAIALVGRMEYQKNHRLALEAMACSPELRERAVLHFIGAGEEEQKLRELTRNLRLEACVRFHGYRTDARRLLAGADVLLMTSWFEGMPLTLIEAMLSGVPIVTTPWTGALSMTGQGMFGIVTAGWTPAHVAAQLERAIAAPESIAKMAERAQEHVAHAYRIDRMADAHCQLYEALAEGGAA